MYEEHNKGFLEELQSLDEPTKKKIMIVATIVIMGVVIYFWLAYFNNLVASVAQPSAVTENGAASGAVPADSSGAGWSLANGAATVYGAFKGALRGLANILQAPRQYIITPPQ